MSANDFSTAHGIWIWVFYIKVAFKEDGGDHKDTDKMSP